MEPSIKTETLRATIVTTTTSRPTPMKPYHKLVLAGGSGFLGKVLAKHFASLADEIVILTRAREQNQGNLKYAHWDGRTLDAWQQALEGADALVNLAGRSVDCRYNTENRARILLSRVESTAVLGKALQRCQNPPKVWLQAASATYYRHAEDHPQDEVTGEAGQGFSVEVCQAWERTFWQAAVPNGVRRVLLRVAMVMGREGGVYPVLARLVRFGLGGTQGSGNQMISWIHEDDLARMVEYCLEEGSLEGTYNCSSPYPLPNAEAMRILRYYLRRRVGLPSSRWMLELGAWLMQTETELVLKSRWVVPKRMLQAGFEFKYPHFDGAIVDLSR